MLTSIIHSLFGLVVQPPSILAWRPFLDPLNAYRVWWAFLVPLSFGIAVAYKAVRLSTLQGYWRQVFIMTAQIVLTMVLLGIGAYIVLQVLVPLVAPMGR
jgi:hypothetical protein